MQWSPRTLPDYSSVEEVFKNYEARRSALIKALTTDIEEFYQKCDPEKDSLCLYGHPNGNWEVCKPSEMVPVEFPEPALGINFERDLIRRSDWVALVAANSDAWLFSVAFCIGSKYGFGKADRKRLFNMINKLPTILEVIRDITKESSKSRSNELLPGILEVIRGTGRAAKEPPKESSKSSSKKTKSESKGKQPEVSQLKCEGNEDVLVEEEHDDDSKCGRCEKYYLPGEFWIACDVCAGWFHGSCVKITPKMAEGIGKYECPTCNNAKQPLELNL